MSTVISNTLTYEIINFSTTTPAQIRSFSFNDNANIRHYIDLSEFGLSNNFTGNTTISTATHNYVTGSPLRKTSVSASFPVDKTITADNTGTTLQLNNTTGLSTKAGWIATSDDGAYDGSQYIVSVTSATWVEMSAEPLFAPTLGGSITFSKTTNEIVMGDTDGLQAGWTITGNGYTSGMDAYIIEVVGDNATLIVDQLPSDTLWSVSGLMVFTTSTKFLTLDSTSGLSAGWFATNNGYDGTQYIVSIDGNTLTMSDYPGGYPTVGAITFSNASTTLVTISPGDTKIFSIKYENATDALGTWSSVLTVTGNQSTPVVKQVQNYVMVSLEGYTLGPPPLPENRYEIGVANGGGHRVQPEVGDSYYYGSFYTFGGFTDPNTGVSSGPGAGYVTPYHITKTETSSLISNDTTTQPGSLASFISLNPGAVTITYERTVINIIGNTVTKQVQTKTESYLNLGAMIANVFTAAAVVAKVIAVALLPGSIPAVAYAVTTGDYSLISSLWNSIFGTPVDLKTDKEINGLTLTEVKESVWPSEDDVETFTSTTDAEATVTPKSDTNSFGEDGFDRTGGGYTEG